MKTTKSFLLSQFLFVFLVVGGVNSVQAHCEVPCGVYNDSMRVVMIREHITTISKSMSMIEHISSERKVEYNQMVRWVMNKEKHADAVQEIVSQYFMTQRIKFVDVDDKKLYKRYLKELEYLHQMLIYSMKCKQGTDTDNVSKLSKALDGFEKSYFSH